jgi:hypothetical protein
VTKPPTLNFLLYWLRCLANTIDDPSYVVGSRRTCFGEWPKFAKDFCWSDVAINAVPEPAVSSRVNY